MSLLRTVVAPPPERTLMLQREARAHFDQALRGDLPVAFPVKPPCQFCSLLTECAACGDSLRSHGDGGGCLACWQREHSNGFRYEQRTPHAFECPHP